MRLTLSAGQAPDVRAVPALLVGLAANSDTVADRHHDDADVRRRCLDRLKHFRRLATRFNRPARTCLSTVALAAIRLWTQFESRP